jgi:hypothetical protein
MQETYSEDNMDQNNIIELLLRQAQQQQEQGASFRSQLADRRNKFSEINKVAGDRFNKAFDSNAVPVNPSDVFGAYNTFQRAGESFVQPQLADQAAQADQQYSGILKTILDQGNMDKEYQLKAKESGFTIDPATGKLTIAPGSVADPIAEIMKQNGGDLLTAKTADERLSQAKTILSAGGVSEYRKQVPVDQLLTEKELAAREAAFALARIAGDIVGSTENRNAEGIGGLQRFLPGWAVSDKGTVNRANIGEITSQKMKEISGAAISEQEVKRLQEFLPKKGEREDKIETKSKRIYNALQIGIEMQTLAKQNGLTLDQAYRQFGSAVYPKYGEQVPSWIGETKNQEFNPDSVLDELGF